VSVSGREAEFKVVEPVPWFNTSPACPVCPFTLTVEPFELESESFELAVSRSVVEWLSTEGEFDVEGFPVPLPFPLPVPMPLLVPLVFVRFNGGRLLDMVVSG